MGNRIAVADNFGMILSDLACAEMLKIAIVSMVEKENKVVLDLAGVIAMDNAFGDAVFGDLIVKKGAGWLEQHVVVENLKHGPMENMLSRVLARWADVPEGFLQSKA